jgi:hypothetical protein|tara:strand:+ start:101 stop:520 length:420 start_codon:yes stop_codon:yes gene_type:complete
MRYIICVVLSGLLISCSGTGTKNFSAINSMMINSKEKIFVGRQPGYVGSGQVYKIFLNGKTVGKLGAGEMLVGDLTPGLNTLQAKFIGITDFEMGSYTFTFKATKGSNKFIIVSFKMGGFSNSLRLMEVTESSFKHSMR